MPGGLFGIEIAKSGILANQRGIDVTGQNIANVNNDDYHKQRVIMQATNPLFPLSLQGGTGARQIGTGVDVKSIERLRDAFLEGRIRDETQDLGNFDKAFNFLHQVELVYNEPSDNSLRARADQFWKALQDLSRTPEDMSVRAAVRESALGLAEIISEQAAEFLKLGGITSGTSVNRDIEAIVGDLNTSAKEIAELNKQIQVQQAGGHNPNDLLDRRDGILKKLAKEINIQVGENNKDNFLVTVGGITLAHGVNSNQFEAKIKSDGREGIFVKGTTTEVYPSDGELKALYDFRDKELPVHIQGLADFAMMLVEKFNDIHRNGFGLDGNTGVDFFRPYDTKTAGIYKFSGTKFVRRPDLALNGGLFGSVQVKDVNAALNGSSNFNGELDGNLSVAGTQNAGTLSFNDINNRDLNSDGTVGDDDTTVPTSVSYDISTDTLQTLVDKINRNSTAVGRTGAIAKIVDKKLVVNGVYQVSDTGNLLTKLGTTTEKENFESTTINNTISTSGGTFRVGIGRISINNYTVGYDGNVDSLNDIVKRINDAKIGVVAEVNAQNKLVIRGTSATDFKITELSDSGNLFINLGILNASTTFESGFSIIDSGTDGQTYGDNPVPPGAFPAAATTRLLDIILNNINRGKVGQGFLQINGRDIISNTTADSPPGATNDVIYDGSTTHSLENIRTSINLALGNVASITKDNRLVITGVSSYRDTGDFTQVLRIVPRASGYVSGDTTTEANITGKFDRPPVDNFAFFTDISTDIKNDLRKIAAADGFDQDVDGVRDQTFGPGNGDNIIKMAALKDARILDNNTSTMDQFFGSLISTVGIEVRLADTNRQTQLDVLKDIELLNKSISGVSLDEEMINLMKYQRGFQASAKVLTTTNNMIDTLLGMGG